MNKFNLYDFIAVLVPGIFFLWCLNLFFSITSIPINIPLEGDLTKTTILIVLGYIIGLILQGISQGFIEPILKFIWKGFPSEKWLLDDDKRFSSTYKSEFWKKLNSDFQKLKPVSTFTTPLEKLKDLKKQNQECFYLAYRSIKNSDTILLFNAQYGLFRCLLTTFIIIFFTSIYLLGIGWEFPFNFHFIDLAKADAILPILILSTIGIIITYLRTKKRGEDFAKCVIDTFMVQKKDDK